MVSDKMIEAMIDHQEAEDYLPWNYSLIGNTKKDLAQAVVNAAWTEFNVKQSTWPKEEKDYWCVWEGGGLTTLPWFGNSQLWRDNEITHYADPQDLMFKGDE